MVWEKCINHGSDLNLKSIVDIARAHGTAWVTMTLLSVKKFYRIMLQSAPYPASNKFNTSLDMEERHWKFGQILTTLLIGGYQSQPAILHSWSTYPSSLAEIILFIRSVKRFLKSLEHNTYFSNKAFGNIFINTNCSHIAYHCYFNMCRR